jgi:hypothetical protein
VSDGLAALAAAPTPAPYLNLDFETVIRDEPWAWNVEGSGFRITLDPTIFESGTQSLRIQNTNASITPGEAAQQFPIEMGAPPFGSINGPCRSDDAYFRAIGSVAFDGFSLRRDLSNIATR